MPLTVPNILTVFRLLAAPAVALVFLVLPRGFADWAALILFVGASLTDYIDGYLARAWRQVSAFGAMLDPIADKAMVVIAIFVLAALYGFDKWIVIPGVAILFREVFVSGLREYLGDTAGTLKVTTLAKWKTTTQMIAITVLFSQGLFQHYFGMHSYGMDHGMVSAILTGQEEDLMGLRWKFDAMIWTAWGGAALLWVAGLLTLVTGWDYFRKALPHLKDREAT